jgi:hypothetical protein
MSDVLKRTIFIDETGGVVRFHDWAMVLTELGVMMEPMPEIRKTMINTKGGLGNFDALDPMCKINAIKNISLDRGFYIMGPEPVTGGNLIPRTGR